MIDQYSAIAALLGSAIYLFAHLHFDACIRCLLPLAVDTKAARHNAVQSYRQLERQCIQAALGVIACWAIRAVQIAFMALACLISLVGFVVAERHNFHRDGC